MKLTVHTIKCTDIQFQFMNFVCEKLIQFDLYLSIPADKEGVTEGVRNVGDDCLEKVVFGVLVHRKLDVDPHFVSLVAGHPHTTRLHQQRLALSIYLLDSHKTRS